MLVKNNTTQKWCWYGAEITEAQYNDILIMLRNPPEAPAGWAYRLTEDLRWELVELPPVDEDPEISAEEALAIMLGGCL